MTRRTLIDRADPEKRLMRATDLLHANADRHKYTPHGNLEPKHSRETTLCRVRRASELSSQARPATAAGPEPAGNPLFCRKMGLGCKAQLRRDLEPGFGARAGCGGMAAMTLPARRFFGSRRFARGWRFTVPRPGRFWRPSPFVGRSSAGVEKHVAGPEEWMARLGALRWCRRAF